MELFTGSINATYDINTALQMSMAGFKVLYVGELNPNIPQQFIPASVLLPSFDAINAEIDGNMPLYSTLYSQQLMGTKECFEMFATMLIAIHFGVHIILYVEEGANFSHAEFLLTHMQNTYGISCGLLGTDMGFMYDKSYDGQNASILYGYMDGFITLDEYLTHLFDASIMIKIPFINPLGRLLKELNVVFPDIQSALIWVQNYVNKASVFKSVEGPLVSFKGGK